MNTFLPMAVGKGQFISSIYKWEIDDYSSLSFLKIGEAVYSPNFDIHGYSWCLQLYPNRVKENFSEYIALYLILDSCSDQSKVHVRHACSLIDDSNKTIGNTVALSVFKNQRKGWGKSDFLKKSLLNTAVSNKITIMCEIIIKDSLVFETKLTVPTERLEHLRAYKSLINNPKFSDVKFTVEKKEILAHKVIMAANSSVFAAMFDHEMQENKENAVMIEDVSYSAFLELLRFIYTGECTLSDDNVCELFEAADKYQLLKLKDVCEQKLCKNMSVDNVIRVLHLADMHSAERLKKEAIAFIALHGKDVVNKSDFEFLKSVTLLKDILRGIFDDKKPDKSSDSS